MTVISEKIDKEMCPVRKEDSDTYAVVQETTTSTQRTGDRRRKIVKYTSLAILLCILFFIAAGITLQDAFICGFNTALDNRVHTLAKKTIDEAQTIVEAIRQENTRVSNENRQIATEYLDDIQNVLKKRVENRVKKISKLVLNRVQDIENQLAVFERAISTTVDGNLNFTKTGLVKIKSNITEAKVNDSSTIKDAVNRVGNEISQFTSDLDQMYSFYGSYINNILHNKTADIMDRVRMILVADRKLFRNATQQHVALCYKISRQNYDICINLEMVFIVIGKLFQEAINTVDALSSTFINIPSVAEVKRELFTAQKDTVETLHAMMSTDANFLGTVLKELAYAKHLDMKNIINQSYGTVIRSLIPAVEKVCLKFKVVRESHWQRINEIIQAELSEFGSLIQTKVSLMTDNNDPGTTNEVIERADFKSAYALLADTFKNASSVVNSLFKTKQGQMLEGLSMSLEATVIEQVPIVGTWSLKNYVPANGCPMSIDFQAYLKATMNQYLSRLMIDLQVVSGIYERALELDTQFNYVENDNDEGENRSKELLSSTVDIKWSDNIEKPTAE